MRVASRFRQTNTSATALHRYDGSLRQLRPALGDDTSADRRLFQITEVDESDDSGMGSAEGDRKLAEILVERYEHLAVLRCVGENLVVAWVGAPIPDPLHRVPGPFQLVLCTGPDAAVQQELQAASSVMAGSMRSWPTTRRA